MKMKKNYIDLFRLWLRNYFKHPVENIRQANPIVPGRLYHNFGNACKAVAMTERERQLIRQTEKLGALPIELLRDIKEYDLRQVRQLYSLPDVSQKEIPSRCSLCDFYKKGVPCPLFNILKDGSTVCDTHRYVIIKPAPRHA